MTRGLFVLAALALVVGCKAPADAKVLLDFADNGLPGLRKPAAVLDVLDEDGAALAVEVRVPGEKDPVLVQSPLPVPCTRDGTCAVDVSVRPGKTSFVLHVSAEDRCGVRGELIDLASRVEDLAAYTGALVELFPSDAGFDDDDDGLPNVLENATCGRFDFDDGAAPPSACVDDADPCCAGKGAGNAIEGRMTAFAGGPHVLRDGSSVEVAPFALDATEVTWRQLARCVGQGLCLPNEPSLPVRQRIASEPPDAPVVGLTPAQAQQVCEAYGKRLPLDVEWDFAAAHREGGARGRFPFDADDGGLPFARRPPFAAQDEADIDVGCRPSDGGIAANHEKAGVACPGAPLPVGSYGSSYVRRGSGPPLADLAGNAAEWTLVAGDAPAVDEVPAGFSAAVLRGGGALSAAAFLENDLPIVAKFPASGDVEAWRASLARLSVEAGFRCALTVEDGTAPPPSAEEPACAAP